MYNFTFVNHLPTMFSRNKVILFLIYYLSYTFYSKLIFTLNIFSAILSIFVIRLLLTNDTVEDILDLNYGALLVPNSSNVKTFEVWHFLSFENIKFDYINTLSCIYIKPS